ncbi:MAG: hypothetical protein HY226_01475 [Candidatus Vogelbacteria bacterium]|nr:hypothetical protein [Candidatus Vogelbacteria bacterium]
MKETDEVGNEKTLAELGIDDSFEKHVVVGEFKVGACYIFLKRDEQSFQFKAISLVTYTDEEDYYEILFHGEAYFDGIRHLYFGSEDTDNYGYHYYPNLKTLIAALTKLSEVESELDYVKQERK